MWLETVVIWNDAIASQDKENEVCRGPDYNGDFTSAGRSPHLPLPSQPTLKFCPQALLAT